MPSLLPLRAARALRLTPRTSLALTRPLSTTTPRPAYKDDQDRESLNPKAPYGSQSAGDEAASHNPDSYSRNKTDPPKEKSQSSGELDVSGANQELSKPQGDTAGKESAPQTEHREARSGGSSGGGKAGKPN